MNLGSEYFPILIPMLRPLDCERVEVRGQTNASYPEKKALIKANHREMVTICVTPPVKRGIAS